MNIYAVIILSALILESVLNLIADLLNLRTLSGDVPEEFETVYNAEKYRKSQAYTRVKTRFGFITSGFDLVTILAFWFSGGFSICRLQYKTASV